jgi:pimeloyl-ACP methyl ester carboxylesterase
MFDCAGFEIHAVQWGEDHLPPLLMMHGLARTGRDFDPIAAALSDRFRVICPDQIGRGFSQWSNDPDADYRFARYEQLAAALADTLQLERFLWLGTSMGGALGLHAAAGALRGRITAMVVNDIGPELPEAAVTRIRTYAGTPPVFPTMGAYEGFVRTAYRPFGEHTDAQWRHLAETTARRLSDGRITTHYDPQIVRQLDSDDYDLWPRYDSLDLPMLVLRGAESDLLTADIATRMTPQGPRPEIVEIPGCGHAPGLNTPAQIALVADFLAKNT